MRLLALLTVSIAWSAPNVTLLRTPNGGLQPQGVVDSGGRLHLIYLAGEPSRADVYYVRSSDGGATFSAPLRVNSQPGSAIAAGTIRGAEVALGRAGRVHVAWNGTSGSLPRGPLNPEMPKDSPYNGTPMLYARLNDAGTAFEPQRNLMQSTFGLDGGGALAADSAGNVYVGWHAKGEGAKEGEAGRRVWLARSTDDGKTFAAEAPADNELAGACGCCGMTLFAAGDRRLYALYRAATENVHRGIHLLVSKDNGLTFRGSLVQDWNINACPMSSLSFAEGPSGVAAAWETENQVYFGMVRDGKVARSIAAPGVAKRKHPRLAVNARGEMMMVWAEGTGWQKGGSLAWQVFDREGKAVGAPGSAPGIPTWSFAAAIAKANGDFAILY